MKPQQDFIERHIQLQSIHFFHQLWQFGYNAAVATDMASNIFSDEQGVLSRCFEQIPVLNYLWYNILFTKVQLNVKSFAIEPSNANYMIILNATRAYFL